MDLLLELYKEFRRCFKAQEKKWVMDVINETIDSIDTGYCADYNNILIKNILEDRRKFNDKMFDMRAVDGECFERYLVENIWITEFLNKFKNLTT